MQIQFAQFCQLRWAKLKAKLAAAAQVEAARTRLPDNWPSKPKWWRTLGEFLREHPDASNIEGASYLDEVGAKRERRRQAKEEPWLEQIKRQAVMNEFSRIRKRAGVPGRTAGKKPVNHIKH